MLAAGCGSGSLPTAKGIKACVEKRLPPGSVDRVFTNTEAGVTSVNYFHRGSETDMSVFPSAAAAMAAEKAEARLGDAHDRRIRNVLYSGGGAVEAAIMACVR
jgi:hypothetical protein